MKSITFIAAMALPLMLFSQSKEIYGGVNYSNYYWMNNESIKNSNNYLQGAQVGFLWGRKEKNIFGKRKLIHLNLALEYNFFRTPYILLSQEGNMENIVSELHNARVSLPIRINFNRKAEKIVFFGVGEPGVNLTAFQSFDRSFGTDKMQVLDLFVKAGLGASILVGRKKYEKSGYKFSAITISGNKYIRMNPFLKRTAVSGMLDQYQMNLGLKFSYVKVKKKRRFKLFSRK